MAKKMAEQEFEETQGLNGEAQGTQKQEDSGAQEVVVNTKAKKVNVHVVEKADFYVAKTHYELKKDKNYSVPSDVAAILVNAGKAYRI